MTKTRSVSARCRISTTCGSASCANCSGSSSRSPAIRGSRRFDESLISAQFPNRGRVARGLCRANGQGQPSSQPSMRWQELWEALMREAVESRQGDPPSRHRVDRLDGSREDTEVMRVGAFAIIDQTGYVNYDWDLDRLGRTRSSTSEAQFKNTADNLFEASPGDLVSFAIDPTPRQPDPVVDPEGDLGRDGRLPLRRHRRRALLPAVLRRRRASTQGSIIIIVGIIGVLLAIERLVTLTIVGRKGQPNSAISPRHRAKTTRSAGSSRSTTTTAMWTRRRWN